MVPQEKRHQRLALEILKKYKSTEKVAFSALCNMKISNLVKFFNTEDQKQDVKQDYFIFFQQ